MPYYYPYAVIETNVDPKFLKYNIKVINTVTGAIIKDTNLKVKPNIDYDFIKISNGLYKTLTMKLLFNNRDYIENVRDCVIVFDLFRITNSNTKLKVIDNYYVNNTIEQFNEKDFKNVTVDKIKYFEKKLPTKVIIGERSSNTVALNLKRNRIFQCLDSGFKPGEDKDPFSKERIEAGLHSRLNEPLPDQYVTSLCGPAAYFFCLINLSSSKYKIAVKQLWESGETTIGKLKIKPQPNGCRKVSSFHKKDGSAKIPPIDWITLASLRESENLTLLMHKPDLEIQGITTWNEIYKWFEKSGFLIVKKFPFYATSYYPSIICELNSYAKDHYIVTLINASLLSSGTSSGLDLIPDHWIVWTDQLKKTNGQPIKMTDDPYQTEVKLNAFSWGTNKQQLGAKKTFYDFSKRVFFALVIKKDKF